MNFFQNGLRFFYFLNLNSYLHITSHNHMLPQTTFHDPNKISTPKYFSRIFLQRSQNTTTRLKKFRPEQYFLSQDNERNINPVEIPLLACNKPMVQCGISPDETRITFAVHTTPVWVRFTRSVLEGSDRRRRVKNIFDSRTLDHF